MAVNCVCGHTRYYYNNTCRRVFRTRCGQREILMKITNDWNGTRTHSYARGHGIISLEYYYAQKIYDTTSSLYRRCAKHAVQARFSKKKKRILNRFEKFVQTSYHIMLVRWHQIQISETFRWMRSGRLYSFICAQRYCT